MSLDVYLKMPGQQSEASREAIFVRRDGAIVEITREEWDALHPGVPPVTAVFNAGDEEATAVFTRNITHNLARMADVAGIFNALWEPEEIGITRAWQLIEPLTAGLATLRADPDKFRARNPANGWGDYDGLVQFVDAYLAACRRYPDAHVSVWR